MRDEEGRDCPWGKIRLPTLTMTCVVTELFTREVEKRFFEAYSPFVDDFLYNPAAARCVPRSALRRIVREPALATPRSPGGRLGPSR